MYEAVAKPTMGKAQVAHEARVLVAAVVHLELHRDGPAPAGPQKREPQGRPWPAPAIHSCVTSRFQ
jgi:hypothetical protein